MTRFTLNTYNLDKKMCHSIHNEIRLCSLLHAAVACNVDCIYLYSVFNRIKIELIF